MKEKEITEELLRKIKYLRDNYGANGTEIARKFRLPAALVNYHLSKDKAKIYRETFKRSVRNGDSVGKKSLFTDDEIESMVELRNEGKSYKTIGAIFNSNHSTCRNYILRHVNKTDTKPREEEGGTNEN